MGKRRAHLLCVLLLATGGGCIHVAPEPLSAERSATALEIRNLAAPELRDFIAAQSGARPEAWPLPSWNLEDLTLAALFFAPDLREARAGADVATAGVRTAGQLPNPTLSVLPQGVSNAIAGASPWIAVVQIDWTIETAGKRGHRRAAAQARADAAALALPSAVWSLRGRLVEAVVRSQGGTFAIHVGDGDETVAVLDVPAARS